MWRICSGKDYKGDNMIKKIIKYFTPFQWAEVLAVTGFTVYFALTDEIGLTLYNILSAFAAI